MSKSIVQTILRVSVQKTSLRDTKYSRDETILKFGHHGKAIAFANCSAWVKN